MYVCMYVQSVELLLAEEGSELITNTVSAVTTENFASLDMKGILGEVRVALMSIYMHECIYVYLHLFIVMYVCMYVYILTYQ